MRRLTKVDDDADVVERFYSLVAQAAGHEFYPEGVALMLASKINDLVSSGQPPIMAYHLDERVPDFIDALVDDKDIAEEAKLFYQEPTAWAKK